MRISSAALHIPETLTQRCMFFHLVSIRFNVGAVRTSAAELPCVSRLCSLLRGTSINERTLTQHTWPGDGEEAGLVTGVCECTGLTGLQSLSPGAVGKHECRTEPCGRCEILLRRSSCERRRGECVVEMKDRVCVCVCVWSRSGSWRRLQLGVRPPHWR